MSVTLCQYQTQNMSVRAKRLNPIHIVLSGRKEWRHGKKDSFLKLQINIWGFWEREDDPMDPARF